MVSLISVQFSKAILAVLYSEPPTLEAGHTLLLSYISILLKCFYYFETRSHKVAQASLKFPAVLEFGNPTPATRPGLLSHSGSILLALHLPLPLVVPWFQASFLLLCNRDVVTIHPHHQLILGARTTVKAVLVKSGTGLTSIPPQLSTRALSSC